MDPFYVRVIAMAISYIAFSAPLFSRGLVYAENDVPSNPRRGVDRSHRFMLGILVVLVVPASLAFYMIHQYVDVQTWQDYGLPALIGCAISWGYGPIRLWHRLRAS